MPHEPLPLTVYTPESSLARPGKMLKEMFADLLAARELAWRLAVRDISAQYRQTFLGFLWALIVPLANTLVWVFLSSSGMVRIADTSIPYPVYVFTGTMLLIGLLVRGGEPDRQLALPQHKRTTAQQRFAVECGLPRSHLRCSSQ